MALLSAPDRGALRRMVYALNTSVRPRHKARFRGLEPAARATLNEFTRRHYGNVTDEGDVEQALAVRLDEDRRTVIPWLDAALPLDGARVLEIGCGTGESTLALAEQGARVTGVDVDEGALAVGRERCRLHGLDAEFVVGNAATINTLLPGRTFDIVIYFASMEHMTLDERLATIAQTWAMVRPGGIWCVNEAPNRLWFWDGHTSFENFYNWLPDEVASRWAHRARRKAFADAFPKAAALDTVHLARWGRGISYHELELVLGDARTLDVVSGKRDFIVRSNPALFAWNLFSRTRRYERFLERLEPAIHPAFFRQYMDVIIRKPGAGT